MKHIECIILGRKWSREWKKATKVPSEKTVFTCTLPVGVSHLGWFQPERASVTLSLLCKSKIQSGSKRGKIRVKIIQEASKI